MDIEPTQDPRVLVDQLIESQAEIIRNLQQQVIDNKPGDINVFQAHVLVLKNLIEARSAVEPRYLGAAGMAGGFTTQNQSKLARMLGQQKAED